MNATATERSYISVTDTAKELRKALKTSFPQVTFRVHSKKYSMGASIDVGWEDGPTEKMVEKVAKRFQGASFDGSIDLKTYHDSIYEGRRVHWGADYVFCQRRVSKDLLANAATRVSIRFGIEDMPPVIVDQWGTPRLDPAHPKTHERLAEWQSYDIQDLVYQESYRLYRYHETTYRVVE